MGSKRLAILRSSLSTVQKHPSLPETGRRSLTDALGKECAIFWCRDLLWILVCWIQSKPLKREAGGKLFGQNVPIAWKLLIQASRCTQHLMLYKAQWCSRTGPHPVRVLEPCYTATRQWSKRIPELNLGGNVFKLETQPLFMTNVNQVFHDNTTKTWGLAAVHSLKRGSDKTTMAMKLCGRLKRQALCNEFLVDGAHLDKRKYHVRRAPCGT